MATLTPELIDRITNSVSANFDAQIEYTQKLIQFGGQRGEEFAVQDWVFGQYASRGYSPVKIEMDPEALAQHEGAGKFSASHSRAPVVVGVHKPKKQANGGKSLILNGHIDVVPLGPLDLWTDEPYSGRIDGDKLYGRGSADMRAGAAANVWALDALRSVGLQPASEVILEAVVEEESTGNGTMMTHLKGYKADAALVPEPTNEQLTRANVGVLWFQVEVRGIPVHVREMGNGTNAIDACWRVIGALRELEEDWNARKVGIELHVGELKHPLNLNIAIMNAGDWASSVPAWCRVDCRIAIYPGTNAKEAAAEIEKQVADFANTDAFLRKNTPTVTWNGFFAEGYVLQPGSEAEKVLHKAHQLATGEELATGFSGAYLDSRIHVLYDNIPSLCYGPIGESVHGFDEWVSIKSLKRVTVAMALFIAEWCGVEDI